MDKNKVINNFNFAFSSGLKEYIISMCYDLLFSFVNSRSVLHINILKYLIDSNIFSNTNHSKTFNDAIRKKRSFNIFLREEL